MKSSVQFRDGKKPLLRVKLPVTCLGMPLLTGCSIGDKDDVALHISSHFDVGPSVRLTYRPNDDKSPTTLVVKAGLGKWLASGSAPFAICAEVNLAEPKNPRIMLKSMPRIGDFSFRKAPDAERMFIWGDPKGAQSQDKLTTPNSGPVEMIRNGSDTGESSDRVSTRTGAETMLSKETHVHGLSISNDDSSDGLVVVGPKGNVEGDEGSSSQNLHWALQLREGWSLGVRSSLPLGKRGQVSFKWRLNLSKDIFPSTTIQFDKVVKGLPVLALDKISFDLREPHCPPFYAPSRSHPGVSGHLGAPKELKGLTEEMRLLNMRNLSLQKSLGELKGELARPGRKQAVNVSELLGREEAMLRSQVFDDLHRRRVINGDTMKHAGMGASSEGGGPQHGGGNANGNGKGNVSGQKQNKSPEPHASNSAKEKEREREVRRDEDKKKAEAAREEEEQRRRREASGKSKEQLQRQGGGGAGESPGATQTGLDPISTHRGVDGDINEELRKAILSARGSP